MQREDEREGATNKGKRLQSQNDRENANDS